MEPPAIPSFFGSSIGIAQKPSLPLAGQTNMQKLILFSIFHLQKSAIFEIGLSFTAGFDTATQNSFPNSVRSSSRKIARITKTKLCGTPVPRVLADKTGRNGECAEIKDSKDQRVFADSRSGACDCRDFVV